MIISAPLTGVSSAAGNNASGINQPLPANRSYTALRLPFGGTVVASNITEVQLQVGNQSLFTNIDGAFLDARNQYDLMTPFATNKELILLQQTKLLDVQQARATILGVPAVNSNPQTAGGTLSFKVEGATDPTYVPAADYVPGLTASSGLVTRLTKQEVTVNGAGVKQVIDLPAGDAQRQFIRRIFMKLDSGDITRVRLLNSAGAPLFDRSKAVNDDIISGYGQHDPAAATNYFGYVLDMTESGFSEVLDTLAMQAVTLEVTMTGAPTALTLWTENAGLPGAAMAAKA